MGLKAATVTPEDRRRRRLAEPDPARGDRRQGDRPHRPAHSRASSRSAACTRRSRSCAWPSATPTARRSGARARARTRSRFRTERIERGICHAVAEYAFRLAERSGAKVFGGPKYTVSPVYEGLLKEEMDAAAARHPEVAYEPQLIDATFALLIHSSGEPLVIPALNRDGDILSDLVLPLFGSIAGSESLLVAFDADYAPTALMAEAAHGTAPALKGKNVANPMAMILAGRRAAPARRRGSADGVAGGARGLPRGRRRGRAHGRPRRARVDERVHRRGDRAARSAKLEVWATL